MKFRFAGLFVASTLCLIAFLPNLAQAGETKAYDGNKNFDELTHAEKTAAKIAARSRKLKELRVCADPGNMPLSSAKGEGFQNKIIETLARAMDTKVTYFWRPYLERGLTRETFANDESSSAANAVPHILPCSFLPSAYRRPCFSCTSPSAPHQQCASTAPALTHIALRF